MPVPDEVARLVTSAAERIRVSPATGTESMPEARADAIELLDMATGGATADRAPTREERAAFDGLLRRRLRGEPMALLRGNVEFMGMELTVEPGVFAPRSSTTALVTAAVNRLRARRAPTAVDVATGAGPVALGVGRAVARARVVGTDVSPDAVRVARANARRLHLTNVSFRRGDVLRGLPSTLRGHVDVITCHPPYVPTGEVDQLPDEVSRYEPAHTLTDGSPDGLGMVRDLAGAAGLWLRPGGWLLVEVSPDRARGAATAFRRHLTEVSVSGARGDVTRIVAAQAARRTAGHDATQGARRLLP
ncbi:MAG TPA: HemK/PrmC family methyltransferase [Candidatus Dormibacteraeota bacterium]|nr:HemK/PrmC family methyltransferase [Candidatus Dormibacteraeota bacterium]